MVPWMSVAKETADPTKGTQYGIELAFLSRVVTPDVDLACLKPVKMRVKTQREAKMVKNDRKGELYT